MIIIIIVIVIIIIKTYKSNLSAQLSLLVFVHGPPEDSLGPKPHIKRTAKAVIRLGGCPG